MKLRYEVDLDNPAIVEAGNVAVSALFTDIAEALMQVAHVNQRLHGELFKMEQGFDPGINGCVARVEVIEEEFSPTRVIENVRARREIGADGLENV